MNLENTWYEMSPFAYGISGIVALYVADGKFATFSAAMLISASLTIISLRRHYRAGK